MNNTVLTNNNNLKGDENMSNLLNLKREQLIEKAEQIGANFNKKMVKEQIVVSIIAKEQELRTIEQQKIKEIAVNYDFGEKVSLAEEQANNGLASFGMLKILRDAKSTKAGLVFKNLVEQTFNRTKCKTTKQDFKKMPVTLIGGFEIGVKCIDKVSTLTQSYRVQPMQESNLLRSIGLEDVLLADKGMLLKGQGTRKILSIKLHKDLFDPELGGEVIVAKAFETLKKGFFVSYNLMTGIATFHDEEPECVGYVTSTTIKYKFLGVTPSGLRTKSVICYAVGKITELGYVEDDRRVEVLDSSIGGAFVKSFLDDNGNFVPMSMTETFKAIGRITMGYPSSKPMVLCKNYILFDNIAKFAGYTKEDKFVSCADTKDGVIMTAVESINREQKDNKYSIKELLSLIVQVRGASAKSATYSKLRKDISFLVNYFLDERGRHSKLEGKYLELSNKEAGIKAAVNDVKAEKSLVVVTNGVRYEGEQITLDIINECLENIDFVGDFNAFKLRNFNPIFELVSLKQGYVSDSKLNTVVNLMLQSVNVERANEIIFDRTKKDLAKKFKALNLNIELGDNSTTIEINEDSRLYNNDPQFNNFLMYNNTKKMINILPAAVRGALMAQVQSIKNLLVGLNPQIESLYTVVQADSAVFFRRRLLAPNEIFCNDFNESIKRVSGARHPISSLLAVSTFNVVSLEKMTARIEDLDLCKEAKEYLHREFKHSKGFCIIPASHDLMEKHDGMDFDIDAMQLILDKDVVELLSQIPNVATVIDRSEDEDLDICTRSSAAELAIMENKSKKDKNIFDTFPVEVKTKGSRKNYLGTINIQKDKIFSLEFDNVCDLIKEYFLNPIASVGEIATEFYNNAYILNLLKSKSAPIELKNKIVTIFNDEYSCNGSNPYESPLTETISNEGNRIIVLNKMRVTKVIYNYHNSAGLLEDTIAFLDDCCKANRYVAETSIDSAKNKYAISNIFAHSHILKALGSDKNTLVNLIGDLDKNAKLYNEIVTTLGLDSNNIFGIELLMTEPKSQNTANIVDMSIEEILSNKDAKYKRSLVVDDQMSALRNELIEYTNQLMVFAFAKLEERVLTLEAKEERLSILEKRDVLLNNKKLNKTAVNFYMETIFATIIDTIKIFDNFEVVNIDAIEEVNGLEYKKTIAIQTLKNSVDAILTGFSKEEKGLLFIAHACELVKKSIENKKSISNLNGKALKVFEEYIMEFFKSQGFNLNCGEKLLAAINDKKVVKLKNFIDLTIDIKDGQATLDDGTIIIADNKRLNKKGIIVESNGEIYLAFEREFLERNFDAGIYVRPFFKTTTHVSRFLNANIEIERLVESKFKADKNKLELWGAGREGLELKKAFEIGTNKSLTEMILNAEKIEESKKHIFYISNKNKKNAIMSISSNAISSFLLNAESEDIEIVNEEVAVDFSEDVTSIDGNSPINFL